MLTLLLKTQPGHPGIGEKDIPAYVFLAIPEYLYRKIKSVAETRERESLAEISFVAAAEAANAIHLDQSDFLGLRAWRAMFYQNVQPFDRARLTWAQIVINKRGLHVRAGDDIAWFRTAEVGMAELGRAFNTYNMD